MTDRQPIEAGLVEAPLEEVDKSRSVPETGQ